MNSEVKQRKKIADRRKHEKPTQAARPEEVKLLSPTLLCSSMEYFYCDELCNAVAMKSSFINEVNAGDLGNKGNSSFFWEFVGQKC